MSAEHVGWVLRQDVDSATAKLVLVAFAQHADPLTGVCWPSRRTVGRYAGIEVRQAFRLVADLEQSGLLTRIDVDDLDDESRGRYERIPATNRPTLWRVGPPVTDDMAPLSDSVTPLSAEDMGPLSRDDSQRDIKDQYENPAHARRISTNGTTCIHCGQHDWHTVWCVASEAAS